MKIRFAFINRFLFNPEGRGTGGGWGEKLISVRLVIGSIFLFGLQVDGPVIVIKGSVCVCVCVWGGGGGGVRGFIS